MIRAIDEYEITGIQTTLPFCKYVFGHEVFIDGSFDTKFVEKYFTPEDLNSDDDEVIEIAGIIASIAADKVDSSPKKSNHTGENYSAWRRRLSPKN